MSSSFPAISDSVRGDAGVPAEPEAGSVARGLLSPEQWEAVAHGAGPGDGAAPLLIIAGAGSGKTKTLATRVAHLIARGADPRRILLMTFSRRAAVELERRTGQILHTVLGLGHGARPPALPWSGTFHSVGARLLREYAPRIGLNDCFTVHDRGDAADLMGLMRHELALSATKKRFPTKDTCLAIYSRAVNSQVSLEQVLAKAYPWCVDWIEELRALFGRYAKEKHAQNVLDYDDLLLYWSEMLKESVLALEVGTRFDHILVDEYQDTNCLQAGILKAMKPEGKGLTVVGDDAQSIYSFRAASVRNILDFPQQFGAQTRRVTLERNYRSTGSILAASNAVIGAARERFTKNLYSTRSAGALPKLVAVRDEMEQARYVADRVLALRESGSLLRSQAVLFRSSSHSAAVELELAHRNIPFVKYGGLKFLESAHVKDLLSLLRWAENPQCRLAGFRTLLLVPGVGPATAGRVLDAIALGPDARAALTDVTPRGALDLDWRELVETLCTLRAATKWPADFEVALKWYEPHLERLYEDAPARRQDLTQLARIAATFGTRERFLTELTLDPPEASSDEATVPSRDDDFLVLSTIHSAKGREWTAVYVLNLVDGCIPSDMATGSEEDIEEERRLLYVAMTRAKDNLELVMPQRYYVHQQSNVGDRHVYALRSRFISDAMLAQFALEAWPEASPPTASATGLRPHAECDVGARLRARWDPSAH
ncbi:MAG: ATP-dependent helicase [Burkholderiaceae bacterium]|jgi:DNA helicase-2/ATP-dependent DNA helicase PcrA